jgi:hypothetical protein
MGGFPIFRWSRADGTGLVSSGMFGSRQTAGRELDMFTVYREEEGEGEEACEGGKRARQVRDGAYRWHQGDIDLRMHNHRFWSHRLPARYPASSLFPVKNPVLSNHLPISIRNVLMLVLALFLHISSASTDKPNSPLGITILLSRPPRYDAVPTRVASWRTVLDGIFEESFELLARPCFSRCRPGGLDLGHAVVWGRGVG